jgi:anti-sigma factor RsiW
MIKTFTQDELIRYVYNELPDEKKVKLENALQQDQFLAEECAELLATKRQVEVLSPKPGAKCISNILRYSQSLNQQL